MTLFFGSRARYTEFFTDNPGTYFFTSGWIERGEATGELQQLSIQHQTGMDVDYEELVEKYGEDNARFLYDQLCDYTKHYRQVTFIDMGVGPQEQFEAMAEQKAADRGWKFDLRPRGPAPAPEPGARGMERGRVPRRSPGTTDRRLLRRPHLTTEPADG